MQHLTQQAKNILAQNTRDGFTVPTDKLYPFQWNWDSAFVSLGFAHYDMDRCMAEWTTLFSGQWENGMIPHILFHSETETTYFPNWPFWNTTVNKGSSQSPKTSGITQPPVHGFILESIYEMHKDDKRLIPFLKKIFPKVVASQKWFYTYRDPKQEGLVFIYHPWESGRDNSPLWDDSMARIEIDYNSLPKYERQDNKLQNASERPTQEHYDKYVYLLELGKRHQYDGPGIYEESPLLIQDTLMNSVLIKSNESLIRIGEEIGVDTGEIKEWYAQSTRLFREKLWEDSLGCFVGYDMRSESKILHKEVGGFCPLYSDIPNNHQSQQLTNILKDWHERGFGICPSFDIDSPLFDSKRYWRGPIWPQMNWLIYRGLKQQGADDLAQIIRNDLIDSVSRLDFHEYFEPNKEISKTLHKGYGGNNFSWTASSIIDLLLRP